MEPNILRHPRNFIRNANTSCSTTQNNIYNIQTSSFSNTPVCSTNQNDYPGCNTNQNDYPGSNTNQNDYPGYIANQNTSLSANCMYNRELHMTSDHNVYRTVQNVPSYDTNQEMQNTEEDLSNNDESENETDNCMNNIYNSSESNFMHKPNKDNYNGNNQDNYGGNNQGNYGGNNEDNYNGNNQDNYGGNSQGNYGGNSQGNYDGNSQGNYGGNCHDNEDNYGGNYHDNEDNYGGNYHDNEDNNGGNYYDNQSEPNQYTNINISTSTASSHDDDFDVSQQNSPGFYSGSSDSMQSYNQNVSWNRIPTVTQNSVQKSIGNPSHVNTVSNSSLLNSFHSYTLTNKSQRNIYDYDDDDKMLHQNNDENNKQNNGHRGYTQINNNLQNNEISDNNTNDSIYSTSEYNAEQNSLDNAEQFTNNERDECFSYNKNPIPTNAMQKLRADYAVVLNLLRDMCTAVEIAESSRRGTRSSQKTSPNDSFQCDNNFSDRGFQDKEFDEEDFEEEESENEDNEEELFMPQKEPRAETSSAFRYSVSKDDNLENEDLSFEELSDEESEENDPTKSSVSNNTKTQVRRKSYNQRRNIRNVFADKQLDAKTQLLREKEKERLQRLGLRQSIENTGKMLRAQVKKTVPEVKKPADSGSKKNEVICLDSDSDEGYQGKTTKSERGKEPILVLSSDSEGEDGSCPVFDELVQSEDYYSELGLHTNDSLNTCDSDGRILINVNHNKDDQDIFLHPSIGNNLKPHQIGGVRFLFDNLIESVAHFRPEEGNGCILAHAMGLGKTIQTITFIDLFLRYTSARKVLCVVPVNTIQNWMNEFNRWLPAKHDDFNICDYVPKVTVPKISTPKSKKVKLTKKQEEDAAAIVDLVEDMVDYVVEKQMMNDVNDVVNELLNTVCEDEEDTKTTPPADSENSIVCDGYRNFHVFLIDAHKNLVERAKIIEQWDKCGGVLLAGYEMYRSIAMYKVMTKVKGKVKKGKKLTDENGDVLLRLKKCVCKPGPDLVVCDEGHRIRNYQSGISQALKSIKTRKRLVLTGYPLQNNLIEYWCMVDFVRPNYLGSRQEFSNMFERPIMNGQCVDSTPKDKHLMKQRAHVLYSLLQGFVQRRGHDVFNEILPHKEEHVLMIRLSPIQKALYNRLIELTRDAYNDSLNPVKTFSLCCKIWNHPDILYDAIKMSQEGKKIDIIGDEDDIALDDSGGRQKRKRKQPTCLSPVPNGSELLMSNLSNIGFDPFGTEARDLLTDILQWAGPIFKHFPYKPGNIENSGKFVVLKALLDHSLLCGDKMLLFSQSLLTLNAIELMLQKTYKHVDGTFWKKGRDYYRLDGGTNSLEREKMINNFNDEHNNETKLFILSTRAGCLGINLVAANRVVVFDVSWNPCHDAQAVCRIYRYGQKKSCHIYRLVSSNTMEKKIYYRQLSKQGISDRVVDEVNLTENFSKNEIQSLVIEDWVDEPFQDYTTSNFSFVDPVLVNTLFSCCQWITKVPFQHESLLINENSQKLSGSEKRAAKREYEQERMMAQGSHVPHRTYPLQQNFPRNTPVAPVRPFLWRPPLTTSWLHNPSSLFHHTVSHNVTVPSSFPASDPLQILRNGTYAGDHSYTGNTEVSNSYDASNQSAYWNNLDNQLASIRYSYPSSNITSVLNRNRSLLHIGPHNDPLARLTQSAATTSVTTSTAYVTSQPSGGVPTERPSGGVPSERPDDSTVVTTTYPLSHPIPTLQSIFCNREADEKSREDDERDTEQETNTNSPMYNREQSLNFEDTSSDVFTSNDTRNFEVIVLDDDEDD